MTVGPRDGAFPGDAVDIVNIWQDLDSEGLPPAGAWYSGHPLYELAQMWLEVQGHGAVAKTILWWALVHKLGTPVGMTNGVLPGPPPEGYTEEEANKLRDAATEWIYRAYARLVGHEVGGELQRSDDASSFADDVDELSPLVRAELLARESPVGQSPPRPQPPPLSEQ